MKSIIPYRRRYKYFHFLGKVKVVPVFVMKAPLGSRSMTPLILNLRTRWRSVLNFTPRKLFPTGGKHDANWIGSWVGPRADPDPLDKRWIEPRFLRCLAPSLVTLLTTTDLLNPVARDTVLCCPEDIRNEKTSFNPFSLAKPRQKAEVILKVSEQFVDGNIHYVTVPLEKQC